ncbi:MAG: hypothetical protein ACRDZ8_10730 [Acidimicrobiales bacterium]
MVPVSGDGSYDSTSFTTSQAGTYRWQVTYSGDGNNNPVGPTSCSDAPESTIVGQVAPVLTTTASAGVAVGGSIDDSAKLAGGVSPTGTITFDLWASVAACQAQTAPSFTTSVPVNLGNAMYPSAPFFPTTTGTYVWTASYSGDGNNLAVSDINCLDSNEKVTVSPAASTPILTTAASASVAVGGSVSDTASLLDGNTPTGTITFILFGPDDANCSATPAFTAMVPVSGNGTYSSESFVAVSTGNYQWTAAYSGDGNNNPVTSACNAANESVTVTKANTTISTHASASVTVGGSISDTATLTGGFSPSATITFDLFGPGDPTCSGTVTFSNTVSVNGDGNYMSSLFTTTAAGTYEWVASYSGDANSNPAGPTTCGDAAETVIVSSTTTTSSSTSTTTTSTSTTTTTTTVPATTTTTTGPTTTTTSTTTTTLPATTTTTTGPTTTTTGPTTTTTGPTTTTVLAMATPTIATMASPTVAVGGSVSDSAALSGGRIPTGSITFSLFGPNDQTCSATPAFTAVVRVNGNGSYDSDSFATEKVGDYLWTAVYSGDSNNNPVTSACGAVNEHLSVIRASTSISTHASASVTVGGSVSDTAALTGGFSPTGTITFNLFGPGDAACTGTAAFSTTVTVNGDGSYTSEPFISTAVGTYQWLASYDGDPDSLPAGPTACGEAAETVTVSATTTSSSTTSSSTTSSTTTAPTTTTTVGSTTSSTVGSTTTTTRSSTTSSSTTSSTLGATTTTTGTPTVQVNPNSVPAGQPTMVTGSGFPAGSELQMDLLSSPVSLGMATANSLGNFAATVVIPAATAPGQHTIVASTADASLRAQVSITVTAAPTGSGTTTTTATSSLSLTGARIQDPTIAGGMLILAGLLSLGVTWRRRRRLPRRSQ